MWIIDRGVSFAGLIGLSLVALSLPVDALEPTEPFQRLAQVRPQNSLGSTPSGPSKPLPKPSGGDPSAKREPIRRPDISVRKEIRSPKRSAIDAFLDVIFGRFPKQGSTQRTAGKGGVCVLAPGLLEADNKIVSDRPLFVWQGNVDQIEVTENFFGGGILMSEKIAPGQSAVQYSGPVLERGQTYVWTLKRDNQALISRDFIVMTPEEQVHLLEQQAEASNGEPLVSGELLKADQLAQNQFWSDALTALMGPSDEIELPVIQDAIQSWSADLCGVQPETEIAGQPL